MNVDEPKSSSIRKGYDWGTVTTDQLKFPMAPEEEEAVNYPHPPHGEGTAVGTRLHVCSSIWACYSKTPAHFHLKFSVRFFQQQYLSNGIRILLDLTNENCDITNPLETVMKRRTMKGIGGY